MKKFALCFLVLVVAVLVSLAVHTSIHTQNTTGPTSQKGVVSASWVLFTPGSFILN